MADRNGGSLGPGGRPKRYGRGEGAQRNGMTIGIGPSFGGPPDVAGTESFQVPQQSFKATLEDTVPDPENPGQFTTQPTEHSVQTPASPVFQLPRYQKPGFFQNLVTGWKAKSAYDDAVREAEMRKMELGNQWMANTGQGAFTHQLESNLNTQRFQQSLGLENTRFGHDKGLEWLRHSNQVLGANNILNAPDSPMPAAYAAQVNSEALKAAVSAAQFANARNELNTDIAAIQQAATMNPNVVRQMQSGFAASQEAPAINNQVTKQNADTMARYRDNMGSIAEERLAAMLEDYKLKHAETTKRLEEMTRRNAELEKIAREKIDVDKERVRLSPGGLTERMVGTNAPSGTLAPPRTSPTPQSVVPAPAQLPEAVLQPGEIRLPSGKIYNPATRTWR